VTFSDSDHCRLSRTRIHPNGAPPERDWVVISGTSHHNRVDHNEMGPLLALANMLVINGTGHEEPQMDGQVCQYNRVDHNYMHDIKNTGGNNWEAMRIGRSWQAPAKGFNVIEHHIDGRSRTAPDVGADEQSADPVKFKGPLTVADVGPDSP
jgi:hypothetical protein